MRSMASHTLHAARHYGCDARTGPAGARTNVFIGREVDFGRAEEVNCCASARSPKSCLGTETWGEEVDSMDLCFYFCCGKPGPTIIVRSRRRAHDVDLISLNAGSILVGPRRARTAASAVPRDRVFWRESSNGGRRRGPGLLISCAKLDTIVAMAGQDRSEHEKVMSLVLPSFSVTPRRSKLLLS